MSIDPMTLARSSGRLGALAYTTADTGPGSRIERGGDASDVFGLDRDDFFMLFLTQLKNQDPTNPLDDKDLIGQLAQFTLIDTMNAVEKALSGTQLAQASSLIGKAVTGLAADGTAVSGVVEKLLQDSAGLTLIVDGQAIRPQDVTAVTPEVADLPSDAGSDAASGTGAGDATEPTADPTTGG